MSGDNPFTVLGDQPLIPELPPRPAFPQRIQRAYELSERYPGGVELLRFYARLAFSQQHVFDSLSISTAGGDASSSRKPKDGSFSSSLADTDGWPLLLQSVLPLFPGFARSLAGISPAAVRDRASDIAASNEVAQAHLLTRFWNGDFAQEPANSGDSSLADRFIALAFLQPYAEWLAQSGYSNSAAMGHAICPICASEPISAVLRDQDHGARRSLVCSLCMYEWNFLRVVCPACGEDRFDLLPVFTPQETPHVRIDACETCHHYLKTVDMTKDGLAVPIVDELAAVSLDLWATNHGYRKLTPNLAGF